MESNQRFATTPPYRESVFDAVAQLLPFHAPVKFLGKVICDSKDFPFKKRMRSANVADDYHPEEGNRERYTHGYFQVVNTQILLEVVLSETNSALHPDGSVSWYHYWKLIPRVVVPWETPGIGYFAANFHEDLHLNFAIRDWQIDGLSGPSVSARYPHMDSGDFQVASSQIELGLSWQDRETSEIPKKVVALIGHIMLASRMLVYGCRGRYHSLGGMLEAPQAQLFLDCGEYFWGNFPAEELLNYCADPDTFRAAYEKSKAARLR